MLNKSVAVAATAVVLLSAVVAPVRAESVKNVVIVHGAFADGSGWRQVAGILVKDGYTVSVVRSRLRHSLTMSQRRKECWSFNRAPPFWSATAMAVW